MTWFWIIQKVKCFYRKFKVQLSSVCLSKLCFKGAPQSIFTSLTLLLMCTTITGDCDRIENKTEHLFIFKVAQAKAYLRFWMVKRLKRLQKNNELLKLKENVKVPVKQMNLNNRMYDLHFRSTGTIFVTEGLARVVMRICVFFLVKYCTI